MAEFKKSTHFGECLALFMAVGVAPLLVTGLERLLDFQFTTASAHKEAMFILVLPCIIFKLWTNIRIDKFEIPPSSQAGKLITTTALLGLFQVLLTAVLLFIK